MKKQLQTFVIIMSICTSLFAQTVNTLAGGTQGYLDSIGINAKFNGPSGVCADAAGNIYVCDAGNHKIRKITPSGVVTTIAGSAQGFVDNTGTSAQFNVPIGICNDATGNLYIADYSNHKIRKITSSGVVTTIAGSTQGFSDGLGTSAKFDSPNGVCIDASGNIYVADFVNHKVRKITPTGTVTTLAGSSAGFADGAGSSAQFNGPSGVCIDASGNVYVSDYYNNRIRKITSAGVVTTFAGSGTAGGANGIGTTAQFYYPSGVGIDGFGNIYVGDYYNYKVRKITPSAVVSDYAGSTAGFNDGPSSTAKFGYPYGVCSDASGYIYVADWSNHRIRKITPLNVDFKELNVYKIFNVYPNPTFSQLNITTTEATSVQIVNTIGKVVSVEQLIVGNNIINVAYFNKGVYFIKTQNGFVMKFIKE